MGLQRVRHNWATELNWTEYHLSSDNNAAEENDDIALQSELNIFKHYLKLQSKSKIRNLKLRADMANKLEKVRAVIKDTKIIY